MKRIVFFYTIISIAQIACSNANAQKIYISIENGFSFGYPSNQIAREFKNNGFNDRRSWNLNILGWESSGSVQYPKTTGNSISFMNRIRVGHKLGANSALEVSFAMPRKSKAEGYDAAFKNFITFESKVIDFSAVYMWRNKQKTLGIGAGPALTLYKLNINGKTETEFGTWGISGTSQEGTYSIDRSYTQVGAAASAFWRIINQPVFFMDLRSDFTFLSPIKTPEINDTKTNANFPSIKLNSLSGDINIAFGVKF